MNWLIAAWVLTAYLIIARIRRVNKYEIIVKSHLGIDPDYYFDERIMIESYNRDLSPQHAAARMLP